ncbi:MAG: tetratricopeptide repeat protein [Breznakibacter sp.]
MKRVILMFSVFALSLSLFAQKGKVISAETMLSSNDLEGAKSAIDEALANEKSNTWPKTYIIAAKVYTKLQQNSKDKEGLAKAMDFYEKASEWDKKGDAKGKGIGKFEKEITLALTFFKTDLINAGVEGFNTENFTGALTAFENVLKASKLADLSQGNNNVDTAIVYNCALAAYNAKNWDKASEYFQKTIELGYGSGDAVLLLHQVYSNTGDSIKMAENLATGFTKYPTDDRILTTLINYYLQSRQNEKALNYLNTAVEQDPKNPSFYYARGVLYDQSKNFDKAEADYLKCLELDANYFNALYNIGVLFYNKGVEKNNEANDLTSMKEFEAAKKVANGFFEKALPYMEKALSVLDSKEDSGKQDRLAVLESLKNLYYRFDNLEKYNQIKSMIDGLQ